MSTVRRVVTNIVEKNEKLISCNIKVGNDDNDGGDNDSTEKYANNGN